MRDSSDAYDGGRTDTRSNPQGSDADNSAGPTPAETIGTSANTGRDAAAGSINESKGRDPEYYAERDIPSET